jgi:hypothetical protein
MIFQKQDQKTILNLTIHHQHLNDFHKTSSMIVRTVTPLFCVGLLRQNWTFCGRRLYYCLGAREKITISFVECFICLLLVSNLNLLSKSKSLLFTNFTSYILPILGRTNRYSNKKKGMWPSCVERYTPKSVSQ